MNKEFIEKKISDAKWQIDYHNGKLAEYKQELEVFEMLLKKYDDRK